MSYYTFIKLACTWVIGIKLVFKIMETGYCSIHPNVRVAFFEAQQLFPRIENINLSVHRFLNHQYFGFIASSRHMLL